jgi:3,4-dihydroxyphenylacetate 2,3-dioxygenase
MVLPEEVRLEINDGKEISLVPGLHRMKAEKFDALQPVTVIVMDTHWDVTFEHVVTATDRRTGIFTSHELPRGMRQMHYDIPGDPELAHTIAAEAEPRDDTWILASDDPYLPIQYGTVNVWTFLGDPKTAWISVGINQCAETEDYLLLGQMIGQAIARLDRRVILLASGGLSHRFLKFRELRERESSSLDNIITPEAAEADQHVLSLFAAGDHQGVLDFLPEYRRHGPEGKFGHYLIVLGAIGGGACVAKGEKFSEYEASVGTGQVHVWFERPAEGWTGSGAAA